MSTLSLNQYNSHSPTKGKNMSHKNCCSVNFKTRNNKYLLSDITDEKARKVYENINDLSYKLTIKFIDRSSNDLDKNAFFTVCNDRWRNLGIHNLTNCELHHHLPETLIYEHHIMLKKQCYYIKIMKMEIINDSIYLEVLSTHPDR